MIRVGFIHSFKDQNWLGGANYLKYLLTAVNSIPDKKIKPVLLTGKNAELNLLKEFPSVEVIQSSIFDRFSFYWTMRNIYKRFLDYDWFLEKILIKNNISILSHANYIGANAKIPTIGWLSDFQYIYYPDFFQAEKLLDRNKKFMKMCQFCKSIILSSFDAQSHLSDFAPEYVSKSRVLQFVAVVPNTFNTNIEELEEKYGFSRPYFHLPNQFWAHKNHRIVIDALHILKANNHKITVIATGNTKDIRNPAFFDSVISYAAEKDILDCFKVLGIVPYDHLIELMLNSVSLINPSFFEGWSTSVEESKSLGKNIILSDIPIHREQNPMRGIFFDPKNAESLSEAMLKILNSYDSKEDQKFFNQAKENLPKRIYNFGKKYEEIVLSVLNI